MPSYGYLLPSRGVLFQDTAPEMTANTQSMILGLAQRAESLGFGSLWIGDSVLAKPRLEPLSTLASVAQVTDSAELGTAVYLPNLRHPVNVAHQTASVDLLSGGRLNLVVGVGARDQAAVVEEHRQMGIDFDTRGQRLDEALDILRKLWSGESVTYHGEFYQIEDANIGMQPCREPPIYLPSATFHEEKGFLRVIRERMRRHASGWMPSMEILYPDAEAEATPDRYGVGLDKIEEAVGKREARRWDNALYQDVVIAETEEEAIEEARSFLEEYYTSKEEFTDEEIRRIVVCGPPSEVRKHIDRYKAAGVETFVTRIPSKNQYDQLQKLASVIND